MARTLRQVIPKAPPQYDQTYITQLADAINRYIFQREAQGEMIAARFVATNVPSTVPRTGPPAVPADDVHGLPTGTICLKHVPGTTGDGGLFLTVVTPQDLFTPPKGIVHRSVK